MNTAPTTLTTLGRSGMIDPCSMSKNFSKQAITSSLVRLHLSVLRLFVCIPPYSLCTLIKASPPFKAIGPLPFIAGFTKKPITFGKKKVPIGAKVGYYPSAEQNFSVIALDSKNFHIIQTKQAEKLVEKSTTQKPPKLVIFPMGPDFQWKLEICVWNDEDKFDETVIKQMIVASCGEGEKIANEFIGNINYHFDFIRIVGFDRCVVKHKPKREFSLVEKIKIKLKQCFNQTTHD